MDEEIVEITKEYVIVKKEGFFVRKRVMPEQEFDYMKMREEKDKIVTFRDLGLKD